MGTLIFERLLLFSLELWNWLVSFLIWKILLVYQIVMICVPLYLHLNKAHISWFWFGVLFFVLAFSKNIAEKLNLIKLTSVCSSMKTDYGWKYITFLKELSNSEYSLKIQWTERTVGLALWCDLTWGRDSFYIEVLAVLPENLSPLLPVLCRNAPCWMTWPDSQQPGREGSLSCLLTWKDLPVNGQWGHSACIWQAWHFPQASSFHDI